MLLHVPHLPLTHVWPIGQAIPQALQFALSMLVLTSQPSFGSALQLANPGKHWSSTHMLFTHLLFALGMLQFAQVQPPFTHTRPCGQTLPQPPQLRRSLAVMTSHPLFAFAS